MTLALPRNPAALVLPPATPARPSLAGVLVLATAALCATPAVSPAVALACGAALALTVGNPWPHPAAVLARRALQASVVLLGFGMNLPAVLAAGREGFAFAACTIGVTLALGLLLGRWLRIGRAASLLIACGTAICGGSAVAAVGGAIDAAEPDMTVAMGTIFLLNAVALLVFPPIGHAFHLTQAQFGTWAGVAIHDTSSVVSAGGAYGAAALQQATAVKLSRALWIVPISLAAAAFGRGGRNECGPVPAAPAGRRAAVPWFILFFFLASLCRSTVPAVAHAAPALARAATAGITLTLFLTGLGLSPRALRAVGPRPLVQGIVLWFVIAAGSLVAIRCHVG